MNLKPSSGRSINLELWWCSTVGAAHVFSPCSWVSWRICKSTGSCTLHSQGLGHVRGGLGDWSSYSRERLRICGGSVDLAPIFMCHLLHSQRVSQLDYRIRGFKWQAVISSFHKFQHAFLKRTKSLDNFGELLKVISAGDCWELLFEWVGTSWGRQFFL